MEKDQNQSSMSGNEKKSNKTNAVLIVLLLILTGLGIFLAVQNKNLKDDLAACGVESEEVQQERDKVVFELENMIDQYDDLQTGNDSLNQELIAEREKVEQLLRDAKNNKWTIYKLKKEASTLREIMKGYVRTIDSLNTLNVELRAENADVNRKLTEKESENEKLSDKNQQLADKVKLGAKLDALGMTSLALKERWNETYRDVSRANNADKIKTCFTIGENQVTEKGKKIIYIRIIAPSGKVLSERNDNTFKYDSKNILYSLKKEVEYENKAIDVCYYWDVKDELMEGDYIVEAFSGGFKIGSTTMPLK